jgi:hypothetical protein
MAVARKSLAARNASWALVALLMPLGLPAQDGSAEAIGRRIAQKVQAGFEQAGNPLPRMLMDAGLSAEDSERAANNFLVGLVGCLLEAAESEAIEQSLPVEAVLLEIEQAIEERKPDQLTIVDAEHLDEKADACAFNEMQRAGISVELLIQQAITTRDPVAHDE